MDTVYILYKTKTLSSITSNPKINLCFDALYSTLILNGIVKSDINLLCDYADACHFYDTTRIVIESFGTCSESDSICTSGQSAASNTEYEITTSTAFNTTTTIINALTNETTFTNIKVIIEASFTLKLKVSLLTSSSAVDFSCVNFDTKISSENNAKLALLQITAVESAVSAVSVLRYDVGEGNLCQTALIYEATFNNSV